MTSFVLSLLIQLGVVNAPETTVSYVCVIGEVTRCFDHPVEPPK